MTTTSWSGERRSFPISTRTAILRRDPICVYCNLNPSTIADHAIPHAEGGADTVANGQGLCVPCHDRKTRTEQARGRERRSSRRQPAPHPGIRR